ncbi:MAG: aminotransferase class I/II-fold pyridoxal phosphate-dependent enzyme [Cyclobacteriaceae bacterium]|nr:aminotransferase class I/II-fold pyridoxal phosphate-dependent enzyme [Cyclobacteriaceae bacterium]
MTDYRKETKSVHSGGIEDPFGGVTSPIIPSTAYNYLEKDKTAYPRYFNTPNQEAVAAKIAALEGGEMGLVFSSGMAATMAIILTFLKHGDHILLQNDIYGGTHDAISVELTKFGIQFSFVQGNVKSITENIRENTKVIFIESPSNPILKITDIQKIANVAKENNIISVIDNTFASPVNQNPLDLGIDIIMHSGTKYLGGHSDISCGASISSKELGQRIRETSIHLGSNLDAATCNLLERSLKTLYVRVEKQNENAFKIARHLEKHPSVEKVYYPGLESHEDYAIAKAQMNGFGGMVSFEVKTDPIQFQKKLRLIKSAISLGGVESTVCSPVLTSHARMTPEERAAINVKDSLIRMSVGIEHIDDLINDLDEALQ